MSWNPAIEPHHPDAGQVDDIETLIIPRARDLGGFEVRRALPSARRQMVGPFIFFDQMGPAEFITEGGIDVRPHPHIGISTVTYLYQGEFEHRDSTGAHQMIYPGEVNLMTAGRGVTHSERTSAATRNTRHSLFGIQTWIALPDEHEDTDATFEHHGKDALPFLEGEGKEVRLILGNAWGEKAPARSYSEMFYADATLLPGAKLPLPDDHEDRGIYVTQGAISVAGQSFDAGQMMVFRPGDAITVTAGDQGARLMLLGGATLNGPRHIWWNFVASSQERIEEAKQAWAKGDWQDGRFHLPPGDDQEFIPLP
ncbi:pirin family protein [uncultured Pelagimonas sp.]|uniref:pirin family protein n=1 Tax=uncultured Pelagimonas sp. TaxID=1618102 RepID=UPI00260DF421|nr:pirin family protein [uncultured Pelagimonas sp.]